MKLTLIEPHHHFGVLKKWVQVCVRTKWHIEVISSIDNWSKLRELIPEEANKCSFIDRKDISSIPASDLILFLSLQLKWEKWRYLLRDRKFGLLIHNGNMYFQSHLSMVNKDRTDLTFFKYHLKKYYERYVRIPQRNKFLQKANFVTPFSSLQLPFFEENSPVTVKDLCLSFKHNLKRPKKDQVLLYIYNRLPVLDSSFLKQKLGFYTSNSNLDLVLISTKEEYAQVRHYFPMELNIQFAGYPLDPSEYYQLIEESRSVCLPFHKNWIFNIYHEEIGHTKYSGRIRDALEYGCEVHVPDDIPLENIDQIPTLEEAAKQLERKLNALTSGL